MENSISCFNKPSFCSGSCDEWHATINFQKQNNLETPSQKHFEKILETSLKPLWKILETPLKTCLKGLNHPWNTLKTLLKSPCGNHETFLKRLVNALKLLHNFHILQLLLWYSLENFMKHLRTSLTSPATPFKLLRNSFGNYFKYT